MTDYSNMTFEQLIETRRDIDGIIEQKRQEAIEEAHAKLAAMGIEIAPIAPPAIKYSDGNGHSWTGKGRKPKWIIEAEENGADIDSFKI